MIIKISVPSRFRLKKTATFRTILMQNQGEIHYIGGADVLPGASDPGGGDQDSGLPWD